MTKITALLTSHNRKALTIRCLDQLALAAQHAGLDVQAVLVDDGSTDGTAVAVSTRFPWVHIERGDGSLFWNRGMHRAMLWAAKAEFDYALWLNDDTDLEVDALQRLTGVASAQAARVGRPVIVVGATSDRVTGRLSYGGIVASGRWRPFAFRKVHSDGEPITCDTMNGNVVLLPASVVRDVGNLDPVFEHAMGDIDYGLRARRRGHPIYVAPGFVGQCSTNPTAGTFHDASLPLRTRWRKLVDRKGLPPRSWMHLTRRHGGWLWPIYFVWPYARLLGSGLGLRGADKGKGSGGA